MRKASLPPEQIEQESFSIIDSSVGEHHFNEKEWTIVRRVIHATCDFDFMESLRFHPIAIDNGIEAIKRGCNIFLDTQMALHGVSQKRLQRFGNRTICYISDEDVIRDAKERGITRASASVEKACDLLNGGIVAIGNAPTALFTLIDLIRQNRLKPSLVIGVPVGFVGAKESKEELIGLNQIPYITSLGNKGGTPVLVAILNSLLIMAEESGG